MNEILIILSIANIVLAILQVRRIRKLDKALDEINDLHKSARILRRQAELVCANVIDEDTAPILLRLWKPEKTFGRN